MRLLACSRILLLLRHLAELQNRRAQFYSSSFLLCRSMKNSLRSSFDVVWCEEFTKKKKKRAKWKIACRHLCRVIYWSAGAGERKLLKSGGGATRFQKGKCASFKRQHVRTCVWLLGREQCSRIPGCVWMGLQGSSSPSSLSGLTVAAWVIHDPLHKLSKVCPSLKAVKPGAQT